MVVFVPGLLGSQLLRRDGSVAWLNLGNTLGHHDLSLPRRLPFATSRDELAPRLPDRHRLGAAARLRLHRVRRPARPPRRGGLRAGLRARPALRGLHLRLAARPRRGRPRPRAAARGARARGGRPRRALPPGGAQHGRPAWCAGTCATAEPSRTRTRRSRGPGPGARRASLLTATPNAGSIPALGAILDGERVGLSHTTLAAAVVSRMPSVYQLLPPSGTRPLVDPRGRALDCDLPTPRPGSASAGGRSPRARSGETAERAFVVAALARARAFHAGLARRPDRPCAGSGARARRRLPADAGARGRRRGPARQLAALRRGQHAASRTCCSRPATAA